MKTVNFALSWPNLDSEKWIELRPQKKVFIERRIKIHLTLTICLGKTLRSSRYFPPACVCVGFGHAKVSSLEIFLLVRAAKKKLQEVCEYFFRYACVKIIRVNYRWITIFACETAKFFPLYFLLDAIDFYLRGKEKKKALDESRTVSHALCQNFCK